MHHVIRRFAAALFLCAVCFALHAQEEDLTSDFKRPNAEEEAALRAVLAQPAPADADAPALRDYYRTQAVNANRLGDYATRVAVYRAWIAALPQDLAPKNNLAHLLAANGEYEDALALFRQVIAESKSEPQREFYRTNLAFKLIDAGRDAEAEQTIALTKKNLAALKSKKWGVNDQLALKRAFGNILRVESVWHNRFGRWKQSLDAAVESVGYGREALKIVNGITQAPRSERQTQGVVADLGAQLARQTQALRRAGRYGEAEESLREYLRLSREEMLPPLYQSGIYTIAGGLRMDQHEFITAEAYFRKADKVYEDLGHPATFLQRTQIAQDLIAALEGQHRWNDALKELARLDDLVKQDERLRSRVAFPFERGYAYLRRGTRVSEAAELFARLTAGNEKRYPPNHFFPAQSRGLQGVALWQYGNAADRAKALGLLKSAVRDYMLPDNIDMESVGMRKEVRDLIFATYLEAMFLTPGEAVMDAMGVADWVRGGLVQEALADAAVRSAANEPGLADLVRKDQDAKNEVQALRKYLAGDEGGSRSPLPEIATQMRQRIAVLEASRDQWQTEIRKRFPGYDRLVRPVPPSAADVAKALAADEALLMLLPTDTAVYVWAVTRSGPGAAARVELSRTELTGLVQDVRRTLDFSAMGSRIVPFNAQAASTLYQRLMVPLAQALSGKQHLIIAAGGALGQIPFGVLLTEKPAAANVPAADWPWLIRQSAVTHIPSLSAWMAVKQFARAAPAMQTLAAWGDPQFRNAPALASAPQSGTQRNIALERPVRAAELEQSSAVAALRYSDIPALPDTRDELLAIAAALQANPATDLHLGAAATRASVLQSSQDGELAKKKVVVFATHGLMAGDLPGLTQPALALASTGGDSANPLGPLLTLDDVLGLKLNADWVLLSACNTAAADGRAEEALSGLARGFFYAGSRSLLVTHWAVESQSASLLTTNALRSWTAHPNERKSESLRQSMLQVMRKPEFSHPAFWAPYALVGDGER